MRAVVLVSNFRAQTRILVISGIFRSFCFDSDCCSAQRRLFMFVYPLELLQTSAKPRRGTSLTKAPPPVRVVSLSLWQSEFQTDWNSRWQCKTERERFIFAKYSGFDRLFSSHRCFRLSLRVSSKRHGRMRQARTCALQPDVRVLDAKLETISFV